MGWNSKLTEEQTVAASQYGSNARLLAGPGTGKTMVLSRRISFLVENGIAEPGQILAITFTRAAAHELRQRVAKELESENIPRISTLHSFALRQLLRNSSKLQDWPNPTRIADDWEERHIILEDIKHDLKLSKINEVRELFARLEADWESLETESVGWTPDPRFISAWREHRRCHGYVLRSELIYLLKRALEQNPSFTLESGFRFLLVDEYQDLNMCDLAIIRSLTSRGLEIYAAGDDDQSIYGFRKAHPEGIRRFVNDNAPAEDLVLTICKRCAPEILAIAEFVAKQDLERKKKNLCSDTSLPHGSVVLNVHSDQETEAREIATRCHELITGENVPPGQILILLRSDRNRAFSKVIAKALVQAGVPVSSRTGEDRPLDGNIGRQMLSLLRLSANQNDSLAWRTLLLLRDNSIGHESIIALRKLSQTSGGTFSGTISDCSGNPELLPRFGSRIRTESQSIDKLLDCIKATKQDGASASLENIIDLAISLVGHGEAEELESVKKYLFDLASQAEADTVESLLHALETSTDSIEQLIDPCKVNILTMHQAKGLSADSVFIPAAEDEYIPGRQTSEPGLSDERRLLYVSMTRARRRLFISYSTRRYGQQQRSGRNPNTQTRELTRFLRDAPLHPH